jgi:hypothetical protein
MVSPKIKHLHLLHIAFKNTILAFSCRPTKLAETTNNDAHQFGHADVGRHKILWGIPPIFCQI